MNLYDLVVDENGYLNKEYSDDGLQKKEKGYEVWTNLMRGKGIY